MELRRLIALTLVHGLLIQSWAFAQNSAEDTVGGTAVGSFGTAVQGAGLGDALTSEQKAQAARAKGANIASSLNGFSFWYALYQTNLLSGATIPVRCVNSAAMLRAFNPGDGPWPAGMNAADNIVWGVSNLMMLFMEVMIYEKFNKLKEERKEKYQNMGQREYMQLVLDQTEVYIQYLIYKETALRALKVGYLLSAALSVAITIAALAVGTAGTGGVIGGAAIISGAAAVVAVPAVLMAVSGTLSAAGGDTGQKIGNAIAANLLSAPDLCAPMDVIMKADSIDMNSLLKDFVNSFAAEQGLTEDSSVEDVQADFGGGDNGATQAPLPVEGYRSSFIEEHSIPYNFVERRGAPVDYDKKIRVYKQAMGVWAGFILNAIFGKAVAQEGLPGIDGGPPGGQVMPEDPVTMIQNDISATMNAQADFDTLRQDSQIMNDFNANTPEANGDPVMSYMRNSGETLNKIYTEDFFANGFSEYMGWGNNHQAFMEYLNGPGDVIGTHSRGILMNGMAPIGLYYANPISRLFHSLWAAFVVGGHVEEVRQLLGMLQEQKRKMKEIIDALPPDPEAGKTNLAGGGGESAGPGGGIAGPDDDNVCITAEMAVKNSCTAAEKKNEPFTGFQSLASSDSFGDLFKDLDEGALLSAVAKTYGDARAGDGDAVAAGNGNIASHEGRLAAKVSEGIERIKAADKDGLITGLMEKEKNRLAQVTRAAFKAAHVNYGALNGNAGLPGFGAIASLSDEVKSKTGKEVVPSAAGMGDSIAGGMPGVDFGVRPSAPSQSEFGSYSQEDYNKTLEASNTYEVDQIIKDKGASLWQVLHLRYMKSAWPALLRDKKKRN